MRLVVTCEPLVLRGDPDAVGAAWSRVYPPRTTNATRRSFRSGSTPRRWTEPVFPPPPPARDTNEATE